ncbi:MAG TPA: Clp protease N-terminal domain-containing protein [Acidimicrobiales bacterium]
MTTDSLGAEHILLGLIKEGEGLAAKALESLGISVEAAREKVQEKTGPLGQASAPAGSPAFTQPAKKVLELAQREALQLGHNYIGTEHLLLGLVRGSDGVVVEVLESLGTPIPVVRRRVLEFLPRPVGLEASSRSGPTAKSREWPRYPMKVASGPSARVGSDGLEFWVTGVLFFDEGVQVFWHMSGIPKPIADLMKDTRLFSANLQQDSSEAYVTLSDDLDTTYRRATSNLESRPKGLRSGTSLFDSGVPDSATRLSIVWQGEVIEIEV